MTPEGQLKIDLYRRGHAIARADITSDRQLQVARLLEGRSAQEALSIVPLVFRICAVAQSCAAVNACEKALGHEISEDTAAARELIVLSENFRELVLRLLLDWPRMIDIAVVQPDMKPLMSMPHDMHAALFADDDAFTLNARPTLDRDKTLAVINRVREYLNQHVFGEQAKRWRQRTCGKHLEDWYSQSATIPSRLVETVLAKRWGDTGSSQPSFLPQMCEKELQERLHCDDAMCFIAQPTWDKLACETSTLCRQAETPLIADLLARFGTGLITRLAARLVELSQLPEQMERLVEQIEETQHKFSQDCTPSDGSGLAQVEAARGRLVHSAHIKNGVVENYRILAPTEWNFHACGPAKRGLEALRAENASEMESKAHLVVTAIDPCVGYELRVH